MQHVLNADEEMIDHLTPQEVAGWSKTLEVLCKDQPTKEKKERTK